MTAGIRSGASKLFARARAGRGLLSVREGPLGSSVCMGTLTGVDLLSVLFLPAVSARLIIKKRGGL